MKTLLALALLTSAAWARIGENAAQLAKRYGAPFAGTGTNLIHFKKNDIYITAVLWKGSCHLIVFSHQPPGPYSLGDDIQIPVETMARFSNESSTTPLTEDQIQKLLEANGGGVKWTRDNNHWRTRNGWFTAKSDHTGLRIETREYAQREPEGKDKPAYDPAKRVDGF